jgi:hypothetical protein
MGLDNDDGAADDTVSFDMRYFLDPSLSGATELVVWLDQNCRGGADGCDRRHVPVNTFDTDRNSLAGELNLNEMFNVIDASTRVQPASRQHLISQSVIKLVCTHCSNQRTVIYRQVSACYGRTGRVHPIHPGSTQ